MTGPLVLPPRPMTRPAGDNPTWYADWQLRPVQPADVPMLYEWVMDPRVNHRWTTRGMLVPYDKFVQRVHDDVLLSLLACGRDGTPLAWATVSSVDMHSGHASVAVVVDPARPRTAGVGPRTVCLLLRYVFAIYPFRKVYFESPEFAVHDFRSSLGTLLAVEGILTEHLYYDGRYWDMYVLAMSAEDWAETGVKYLTRVFRARPGGGPAAGRQP